MYVHATFSVVIKFEHLNYKNIVHFFHNMFIVSWFQLNAFLTCFSFLFFQSKFECTAIDWTVEVFYTHTFLEYILIFFLPFILNSWPDFVLLLFLRKKFYFRYQDFFDFLGGCHNDHEIDQTFFFCVSVHISLSLKSCCCEAYCSTSLLTVVNCTAYTRELLWKKKPFCESRWLCLPLSFPWCNAVQFLCNWLTWFPCDVSDTHVKSFSKTYMYIQCNRL